MINLHDTEMKPGVEYYCLHEKGSFTAKLQRIDPEGWAFLTLTSQFPGRVSRVGEYMPGEQLLLKRKRLTAVPVHKITPEVLSSLRGRQKPLR